MLRSNGENKQFVLDTHALISVIYKEPSHTVVLSFFEKAKRNKIVLYLNEINLGELYYRIWKNSEKRAADEALIYIAQIPIQLVPVDQKFVMAASSWKARYAISYADAFVVETASRNDCPIITGDPKFDAVREVKIIRLKDK